MAFRLNAGQYFATHSQLHVLDARVKLVGLLAVIVGIFCVGNAPQLIAAAMVTLALVALSRVPLSRIAASVKPVIMLLAVLSLFNLFFVRTGDVVVSFGSVAITSDGIVSAVLYTARFVLALQVGSLILLTTTPTQLSDALDSLMSPLARLGLPAHEIAMVFSLMLRFIPTLADETSAILDAQAMRGGALDEGSIAQRLRAVVPVVVALLASGIRHADGLSRALDARCYEGGRARTHWRAQPLGRREALFSAACTLWIVALIALAWV